MPTESSDSSVYDSLYLKHQKIAHILLVARKQTERHNTTTTTTLLCAGTRGTQVVTGDDTHERPKSDLDYMHWYRSVTQRQILKFSKRRESSKEHMELQLIWLIILHAYTIYW